jgi:SPP1 gp7 family putative phage head morphogenesis protein
VPARVNKQQPNGELEDQPQSALAQLLQMPNPLQSQRKFFRQIAVSQMLYGETFVLLLRRGSDGHLGPVESAGGKGMSARIPMPDELWPVRGDMVDAVIDPNTKLPAAWRFASQKGHVEYPAHSVVQVAEVNPYNPLRGLGPMQAAYRTAAKDFVIDRYDEALLQNGGSPGGVLSVDGPLTDADQRAIREAWQEAHGRPEQHRKTAVLPQGTSYTEIGMSPQAMEHEKLREWDRQTVLSIFGVPPVVLGLETLNYATAREQNRIFWETTVLPYLDFLQDEFQHKLIHRLNTPERELHLGFDITGVSALREDMDAKVDRTLKVYTQGHRSFNEAAALSGWDISERELEGADDRYIPVNLALVGGDGAPLTSAGETEGTTSERSASPSQEPGDWESDFDGADEMACPLHSTKDEDELDDVYRRWRASVNMSATELERWSDNDCSRRASLDPAAVIARNLKLLRTKKADWTSADIKNAKRTISFIARMRNMPKGEPVVQGCPSKRDISLRNWAFNPDKASRSAETREGEVIWPERLDTEEKRLAYWKEYTQQEEETIEKVAKRTKRVYRDMLLQVRKKLTTIAGKAVDAGAMQTKAFTDAELQRLLDIDVEDWSEVLANSITPTLSQSMVVAAAQFSGEFDLQLAITSVEDPFVVDFYKNYDVYLAEGPTSTLAREVREGILKAVVSADIGNVTSLREAVRLTLAESLDVVNGKLNTLDSRADRIARTETIKANNGARVREMQANEIERHQWLSSRDRAVRDTHKSLDGTIVKVGEPFKSGLTFPGDRSADAREVVNCRCSTIPILKKRDA